jgi:hypothetical protein
MLFCLPALSPAQSIPDPTPAQLQQIATDLQALEVATSADTTAQATVTSDSAALTQAQTTLANDQQAQATTAANVSAAYATLAADVGKLSPAAQAAFRKVLLLPTPAVKIRQRPKVLKTLLRFGPPGPQPAPHFEPPHFQPQPHFDPPHDWHGDYHGGWQPQPNPWGWVAPVINNLATAPRMIVNPMTGQSQWMSPGQWVLVNQGTPAQSYTWQSLPVWPL